MKKPKIDPWHDVIGEIVSILCYQPEIPHQHKHDLVVKLDKAIKSELAPKKKAAI